jgi:hypothetical protein
MVRRSLILAGSGRKCAPTGRAQVWLDEVKLSFDHACGRTSSRFTRRTF